MAFYINFTFLLYPAKFDLTTWKENEKIASSALCAMALLAQEEGVKEEQDIPKKVEQVSEKKKVKMKTHFLDQRQKRKVVL